LTQAGKEKQKMWQEAVLKLLRDPESSSQVKRGKGFTWIVPDLCHHREYVISLQLESIMETSLEPQGKKETLVLLPTLSQLCAEFVGKHEAFRLWKDPLLSRMFPLPRAFVEGLQRFHPELQFADLQWMKYTLMDMHRHHIFEPRLRMVFYSAYYQNPSIVRYLGDLNHLSLTFYRSQHHKQKMLWNRYVAWGSLLTGDWQVLNDLLFQMNTQFDTHLVRSFPEVFVRLSLKVIATVLEKRRSTWDDLIALHQRLNRGHLQGMELGLLTVDDKMFEKLEFENPEIWSYVKRCAILFLEYLEKANFEEIRQYAPQFCLCENHEGIRACEQRARHCQRFGSHPRHHDQL
jgi:hypothetical protein